MFMLCAASTHLCIASGQKKDGGIILESAVIKLIDGLGMGINGERIGSILQVRREVRKIQFGAPCKEGGFVGLYEFEDKKYGVKELAGIEHVMQVEANYDGLQKLNPVLKLSKEDFIKWVMQFLGESRGAKLQMFMLIEESCGKRKRYDSLLLRWASAPEGEEERQFRKDIANFQVFDVFCTDLVNFLEDLMNSCPKAKAQFQEILRKQGYKGTF